MDKKRLLELAGITEARLAHGGGSFGVVFMSLRLDGCGGYEVENEPLAIVGPFNTKREAGEYGHSIVGEFIDIDNDIFWGDGEPYEVIDLRDPKNFRHPQYRQPWRTDCDE
jgi:hypothetical protein